MKKLKLSHREKQRVLELFNEDFCDDYIYDYFKENHRSYFNKCEKNICLYYGIALREAHTFSFDDYDLDSSDFYLDLMYELLRHTNIRKQYLEH